MSEIATKSGEPQQAVYRLLSLSTERRVKKEYMRKLKPEVRDEVLQIYDDDEVLYSLPDMKYAGLRFMLFTLSEVYAVYLRKCCTERIVAEKTFEALKPKHIRTLQDTR